MSGHPPLGLFSENSQGPSQRRQLSGVLCKEQAFIWAAGSIILMLWMIIKPTKRKAGITLFFTFSRTETLQGSADS